jgi:hypothetical protein
VEGNVKIESLNCNNCGAPLAVPATANYVTCKHCQSQLVVRRTESASSTELARLSDSTERLTEQVAELSFRQELDSLDRAWERERESLLMQSKNGKPYEPSAFFGGIMLFAGGGMIILGLGGLIAGAGKLPLAALIGLVLCLIGIYHYGSAVNFSAAERQYQRKRSQLLARKGHSAPMRDPSIGNGEGDSHDSLQRLEQNAGSH